ncbi:MAG TPA: hypothetical protein VFZ53_34810 [Polyangiaceae bacterium]
MVDRGAVLVVAFFFASGCGESSSDPAGHPASGGSGGDAGSGGHSSGMGPAGGGGTSAGGSSSGGSDSGGSGQAGGEAGSGAAGSDPNGPLDTVPPPGATWTLPSGDAFNATPPVLAASRTGIVIAGATSDTELAGVPEFPSGVVAEAFVAELDRDGAVVWTTPLPSAGMPSAVVVEPGGDVLVVAPFVPDATSIIPGQHTDSVLLVRLDASGNVLKERELAFGAGTIAEGLAVDATGAIYIAGSRIPDDDFPNEYVLLAKYDAEGEELETKVFEHVGSTAYASSVVVTADGDVLMAGVFNGSVNLGGDDLETDALVGSSKMPNGFIARFTPDGEHLDSRTFGGTIFDGATALTALDDGDVLLAGWLSGVANVGGGSVAADEGDGSAFLARLAPSGDARWVSLAAATGSSYAIVTDPNEGRFYVAGNLGERDYLAELSASGELGRSARSASGKLTGRSAAVDARGSIWISGEFTGELDLGNDNVIAGGDTGVCLLRLDRASE